jgi:hypothetical protein
MWMVALRRYQLSEGGAPQVEAAGIEPASRRKQNSKQVAVTG